MDRDGVSVDDTGAIGDVAYLARSDHRVPTLVALTERPRSRSELCELTGVSSSTIRRTITEFETRSWIRKEGYRYEATRLGEAVSSGMVDLLERVETERKLRDVWNVLPDEAAGLVVDAWTDVTVTLAVPNFPYRPVNRFESLLRWANEVRFLRPEIALMEPCLDTLHRRIDEGGEITLVARPSCHEYFFSSYPERSSEMVAQETFSVLECDDLPPYGIALLDDVVALCCYDGDRGTVQALVETDVSTVREWAESTYEQVHREARALDPNAAPV
ncbi:helix-turn-helix transcriptional regulator [Halovivax gelatinilyticus]|uniref:helix-turn-helix transcriptional regulator n=1 Tax=Halovivax gelatinilyticus TaxID=2961597 RepID=UPI0020CA5ACA|nr:MarR family transcriptional regulator [Halovivax gelatinilyticus]